MIIRYKPKYSNDLTMISKIIDVEITEDNEMFFTQARADLQDIVITNLTNIECQSIINELYRTGKCDVTIYQNNTYYEFELK